MTVTDVCERFLKYVSFPTASDEESQTVPSSKKQLALAEYIADELRQIGIENAHVDKNGYVYAFVEGNTESEETLGLIAHMDTSPEEPDCPIKPKRVKFDGEKICLNEEKGIFLSPTEFPEMMSVLGDELIVTDGTTLLGADDKAGLSEIVTATEYVFKNDLPHGSFSLCFTPDEEIGKGADLFDLEKFGATYAYTVDGGKLGTLEFENFNAASATVKITGRNIHPGSAKGKMLNACRLANEFDSLLPQNERPEFTQNREGFFHLMSVNGDVSSAKLQYIIRDHDKEKFELKKKQMQNACKTMKEKHPGASFEIEICDSYQNMIEVIRDNMYTVERAKAAYIQNGVEPIEEPIRGGTDGARLSFMGLPCPNLSTGGQNYHSRFEFVSVRSMQTMTRIITSIITDFIYKPEEN